MIVYRLCKKAYVDDLSGHGAELNGGRWNNRGLPALYTASSRALAAFEVAVHVPLGIMPVDYYMTAIEVPDNCGITKVVIADLPSNWNSNPMVKATQYLGDDFLLEKTNLLLQVPSASVAGDFNYVINTRHPDFKSLKVVSSEPFVFDSRLLR